jgi:hypothetical protein
MSNAYNTEELLRQSLEAIEKHKLIFIDDISTYLPCSRATFYNHQLDKVDDIKDSLVKNRVELKVAMRNKWFLSDSPPLQIALMKLISSDDERRSMSTSFMETKQKHQMEDLKEFSDEELVEMMKSKEIDDQKGGEHDSIT